MSVIAEFRVRSGDFELGRILSVEGSSTVELETLVPLGGATVPLFWVRDAARESFIESVGRHPSVERVEPVDAYEDRTLFALEWDADRDRLVDAAGSNGGQVLSAVGSATSWTFEVRFPTHESLSAFSTDCGDAGIELDVTRVYNPSDPDAQSRYGLTEPQLEALTLAVRTGYYDIPRGCTTAELADELGISDQAVTERLRRGIAALATETIGDR